MARKKPKEEDKREWDPDKARTITVPITFTCQQFQDGLGGLFMRFADNQVIIRRRATQKVLGEVDYSYGNLIVERKPDHKPGEPLATRQWVAKAADVWEAFDAEEMKSYRKWKKEQRKESKK